MAGFNRHAPAFAPPPYTSRVAVPSDSRTLPFVFIRSHAFPKQSLYEFWAAVRNQQLYGIPRTAYFLPVDGWLHPTQAMCTGMTALSRAQNQLADLQRRAIYKHTNGMPLSQEEAREIVALRAPTTVPWQKQKRAAARAAGAPALTARQLPPYVVNHMPPAVMKMRAALQQSGTGFMDEVNIVSRQRDVWDLMSAQVRGVLKGRI